MKICNCRKKLQKLCQEIYEKVSRDLGSNLMTIKEKHKDLKKKVNIAEEKRNIRRGQKSWYDLRTLKKLKLKMKDKLVKKNFKDDLRLVNYLN